MIRLVLAILLAVLLILATVVSVEANGATVAFSGHGNPERGFCARPTVAEASRCAAEACLKSGGKPVECAQIRTCPYSGWSMSLSRTTKSGYQWEEFHCGFRTRQNAMAVVRWLCDESGTVLQRCRVVLLANPEGVIVPVE